MGAALTTLRTLHSYPHGATHPEFSCLQCDVLLSNIKWSPAPDGIACSQADQGDWAHTKEQVCAHSSQCLQGECIGTPYTCALPGACGIVSSEWPRQCDGSGPFGDTLGCVLGVQPDTHVCKPWLNGCQAQVLCTGSLSSCGPYNKQAGVMYDDATKAVNGRPRSRATS